MSEEIKVKPSVIQRNTLDVATELTLFYHGVISYPKNVEELQETFIKLYAVANEVQYGNINLEEYYKSNQK